MKRTSRLLTSALALLLCALLLTTAVTPALAASPAEKLSDEKSRTSEEILLPDGTKTGVLWSKATVSGSVYGEDREVNIAEFSLKNTHLSMEVINSGDYMVSTKTLNAAAADYNAAHPGQTVLAAVNGDLWMTAVHSGSQVTTQVLKVPRGILIIDGEIWASQQIDQENLGATNAEKGTSAGFKAAFGVTSQNQPLVGSPDVKVTIANGEKTLQADGVNRLPAMDSLILYNYRVNDTNYALKDAYEVELVADCSAVKAGGRITATVKAIYAPGAAIRPAIGEKSIILTARGNKVDALKNTFKVGDTVTISTEITDRMGRTELWQDVQEAIGGHMQPIIDGRPAVDNGDPTAYPASFVGYRDDGSVVLCSFTSALDGSRAALRFKDGYRFCSEMGFNSVFYLDGGGSATFVTLEEGSYTVRNKCSDGSPRAVINGIAVVWNETPVCEAQGSLSYIKVPVDMSAIPATYMDGALLSEMVGAPNAVSLSYDEDERALKMTTTNDTNDPYATLNYSMLMPASADEYKYIVFKVKTDSPLANSTLMLYYAAGNDNGAAAGRNKGVTVPSSMDEWQYVTLDMSKVQNWTGRINNIRLDIFDSTSTKAGVSVYFGAVVLCKTPEEAAKVADGWAPEGAVTDYLAYLEFMKPETEPETEAPTEPPTEAPTEAVTEPPATVTDPDTQAPAGTDAPAVSADDTTPETDGTAGGCASAVAGSALALLAAAAAALALRKSEKESEENKENEENAKEPF